MRAASIQAIDASNDMGIIQFMLWNVYCIWFYVLSVFSLRPVSTCSSWCVCTVQFEHYNCARIDIHSRIRMAVRACVCVQCGHWRTPRTWKIYHFRVRCAPNERTNGPKPTRMHCELSSAKFEWIPLGGQTIYVMLRDCDDSIDENESAYADCEAYKYALLSEFGADITRFSLYVNCENAQSKAVISITFGTSGPHILRLLFCALSHAGANACAKWTLLALGVRRYSQTILIDKSNNRTTACRFTNNELFALHIADTRFECASIC